LANIQDLLLKNAEEKQEKSKKCAFTWEEFMTFLNKKYIVDAPWFVNSTYYLLQV